MSYQRCERFDWLMRTLLDFPGQGVVPDLWVHRQECAVCQENYRAIGEHLRVRREQRAEAAQRGSPLPEMSAEEIAAI